MSVVTSHARARGAWGRGGRTGWSRGARERTQAATGLDPSRIERAKNADLLALAKRHGVAKIEKRGREWAGLCPFHNEKSPSFTIVPAKRMFHCFGCGWHGDAIKFEQSVTGGSFVDAVRALTGESPVPRPRGVAPSPRGEGADEDRRGSGDRGVAGSGDQSSAPDPDRMRDIARAAAIWREAREANGTPVETYLRARGIDVARIGGVPPTIRYHPALFHPWTRLELPARIDLIQRYDPASGATRPVGIQRVWLTADGAGKAPVSTNKAVLGDKRGGAVRFSPARPVTIIGEGTETVLSVMCALGIEWNDSRATVPGFWCGVDIGNIAGRGAGRGDPHPDETKVDANGNRRRLPPRTPDMEGPGLALPAAVRVPVLLRDRDGADPLYTDAQIARALNRWRLEGRSPRLADPPEGMDFNDWWVETQNRRGSGDRFVAATPRSVAADRDSDQAPGDA